MKTKLLQQEIGKEIYKARQKRKMTQEDLSKHTKIYQSDISKLEKGHANPSIATLNQIAKGLKMELIIQFKETTQKERHR